MSILILLVICKKECKTLMKAFFFSVYVLLTKIFKHKHARILVVSKLLFGILNNFIKQYISNM